MSRFVFVFLVLVVMTSTSALAEPMWAFFDSWRFDSGVPVGSTRLPVNIAGYAETCGDGGCTIQVDGEPVEVAEVANGFWLDLDSEQAEEHIEVLDGESLWRAEDIRHDGETECVEVIEDITASIVAPEDLGALVCPYKMVRVSFSRALEPWEAASVDIDDGHVERTVLLASDYYVASLAPQDQISGCGTNDLYTDAVDAHFVVRVHSLCSDVDHVAFDDDAAYFIDNRLPNNNGNAAGVCTCQATSTTSPLALTLCAALVLLRRRRRSAGEQT